MLAPNAAVRERGILMSAPMVRATLDDRKTQTRRVVLPQPTSPAVLDDVSARMKADLGSELEDRRPYCVWMTDKPRDDGGGFVEHGVRCPYGAIGDRLWVRETAWYDREVIPVLGFMRCFFEGGNVRRQGDATTSQAPGHPNSHVAEVFALNTSLVRRPSIHMPRWASRITLEITNVRVERVQQITEPDAEAEGVRAFAAAHLSRPNDLTAVEQFAYLWDSLNESRGYSWKSNPWVWALTFRRIEP